MNADSIRRALPVPGWALRAAHGALLLVAVIGLLAALQRLERPWQNDAYGFWRMWRDGDLYDLPWLTRYAFVYSPPLGQAIWPLTLMSWPHFSLLWNVAQLSALVSGSWSPVRFRRTRSQRIGE